MITHNIDLTQITPHGQTALAVKDGILNMTVNHSNPLNHCKPGIRCLHYAEIPGLFRLPFRIDIAVNIDVPALYIMPGEGHVNFGVHFDNRRLDDICEPQNKINHFDSHIIFNEYNEVSLIYDLKEMQILINGEERFYSNKEKYMKSPLLKSMNEDGFPLKISCTKHTHAKIKSICVTQYDSTARILHTRDPLEDKYVIPAEKPTFDNCILGLPKTLRDKVSDMDEWLLSLRPMRFRRQVDKRGEKISYVASEQGFSYSVHISKNTLFHTLQWYILTGSKKTWGQRKANRMEETLNFLAQSDPNYANRMFNKLYECVGGYGPGCVARTPYTFSGKKIIACHGKMVFNMNISEFDDAKRFISAVNELE